MTHPSRKASTLDPFVVADEFREVLERKYPEVRYTPWFDVKDAGA